VRYSGSMIVSRNTIVEPRSSVWPPICRSSGMPANSRTDFSSAVETVV